MSRRLAGAIVVGALLMIVTGCGSSSDKKSNASSNEPKAPASAEKPPPALPSGDRAAFAELLARYPNAPNVHYGYGVFLLNQDADAAIKEFRRELEISPSHQPSMVQMAFEYMKRDDLDTALPFAEKAVQLNPSNAQAHLWRADARRQLAATEKRPEQQANLYRDARIDYRAFLNMTNFSSSFFERVAFHVVGSGIGSRRHADRQDPYNGLRKAGYLGLCLTEQKVGNGLRAREYCQRALRYAPNDPITYFVLGNVNRDLYNLYESCEYLIAAARSYDKMVTINPSLDESKNARNYLEQITGILPKLRCSGG